MSRHRARPADRASTGRAARLMRWLVACSSRLVPVLPRPPPASSRRRSAPPRPTSRSSPTRTTRPAGPAPGPRRRGRHGRQPQARHRHEAVLLRPRVPRGPAGREGLRGVSPAEAKVWVARRRPSSPRCCGSTSGGACSAARPPSIRLRFNLPDPGKPATRPIRVGDALVAFPVWAFASDGARGSRVPCRSRRATTSPSSAGHARRSTTSRRTDGRSDRARLARPTRSSRTSWPTGRVRIGTRPSRSSSMAGPSPLVLRGWLDDPPGPKRVGGLFRRAPGDRRRDRACLAAGRARRRRRGRQPRRGRRRGAVRPGRRPIEIAYWADPFVVLHEAAHGWFNGAPRGGPLGERGVRVYYAQRAPAELKVTATAGHADRRAAGDPRPAQRLVRRRGDATRSCRTTATPRRSSSRAGSPTGPATMRCRVWADAAAASAATSQRRAGSSATPSPPPGRPTGAGCSTCSRTERQALRRPVARVGGPARGGRAARRADRRARRRTPGRVALADGWQIPRAGRDALRAWQFDDRRTILADARTVIAQRGAARGAGERSDLALPPTFRDAVRGPRRTSRAHPRRPSRELVGDRRDRSRRTASGPGRRSTGLARDDRRGPRGQPRRRAGRLQRRAPRRRGGGAAVASTDWHGAWNEGRRRLLVLVALVATTMVLGSAAVGWMRRKHLDPASSVPTGCATGRTAPVRRMPPSRSVGERHTRMDRIRRRLATLAIVGLALAPLGRPRHGAPVALAAEDDGLDVRTDLAYVLVPADGPGPGDRRLTATTGSPASTRGGVITRYFYDGRDRRAARGGAPPRGRRRHAVARRPGASARASTWSRSGSPTGSSTAQTTGPHHVRPARRRSPARRATSGSGPAFATFLAWAFGDRGNVRSRSRPASR